MGSTQERIKKRREYIKKKGIAYVNVPLQTFWLMFYIVGEMNLVMFVLRIYPKNHHRLAFASIMLIAFVAGLWAIREFYRSLRHAYREANQLPYVPPVTADTLPAEEVLVRGSEEPAQAQGKVLLRSTDGSAGTGEQELLRSSQGQDVDLS